MSTRSTKRVRGSIAWAAVAASLTSICAPAAELDQSGARLDEIVVTATRRSERLLDIPASIQALTAKDLQRQGADVLSDYARSLAGVTFADRGAGQTRIAIRGVTGGVDLDVGPESTVGVYIDEIPISEAMAQPDLKIVDIERVELLRGPQGTLYGSGSMGGTLRIITPKPDLDNYSGTARATLSHTHGGDINYGADLTGNFPISEGKSALRLSGYYRDNEGFVDDIGTGRSNENGETTQGGRAQLRVELSEAWMMDASVIGQRSRYDSLNGYQPSLGDLIIDLTFAEPYDDDLAVGNVTLARTGALANFLSSTSYVYRDRVYLRDGTAIVGIPAFANYYYGTDVWTQEFRLTSADDQAKLRWVTGLYYSRQEQTYDQDIVIPGLGTIPGLPEDVVFIGQAVTTTRQIAAFGDVTYQFTPRVAGEIGVRIARPELDTNRLNLTPDPLSSSASRSSTQILPKFNISLEPNSSSTLYSQAAKGYRVGGGNIPVAPLPGFPDAPTSFAPDSLWNYEIGAKSVALENRLSLSGAIFYTDWKDVPVQVNRVDGYSWFDNAGDATIKGAEFEASIYPIDALIFQLAVTYLDATLDKVSGNVTATPGERLPAVPRWSGSVSAEVTIPWRNGVSQFVRLSEQYVGGSRTDFGPGGLPMGDYWLAAFRTGVYWNQWEADLYVNNITDERAVLYVNQFGGEPRRETNRPRTIGVSLSYSF